jgi:hypothetical protein
LSIDEVAGAEYAGLLNDLIEDAQKTKASLESRAAGVITTSAALVTLLFGFAAITSTSSRHLPSSAVHGLAIALVLIVTASALAILATAPFVYLDVSTREIQRLTQKPFWIYQDRIEAKRMVAKARVKTLRWARGMNTAKGVVLVIAIVAEVVGIGWLATTVIAVMST